MLICICVQEIRLALRVYIVKTLGSCCPEYFKSRIKKTPAFLIMELPNNTEHCACSGFLIEKGAVDVALYILNTK